jgi:hypothetical protein
MNSNTSQDLEESSLIACQSPAIFVGNKRFDFWGGMPGIPLAERRAFYSAVGLSSETAFPLRFAAKPGLTSGVVEGAVLGFYKLVKKDGNWVGQIENDAALNSTATPASHLTAVPPPPDPAKTKIYAAVALTEYIRRVECDPSDPGLYVNVCGAMITLENYEGAIAYSDAGMAAEGGFKGSRGYEQDYLTYLASRSLFELGRYQEALDRIEPLLSVWASVGWSRSKNPLLSKRGLVKACKAALKLEKKKVNKRIVKAEG